MASSQVALFMAHRKCEHDLLFQQVDGEDMQLVVFGRDQRYTDCIKGVMKQDVEKMREIDGEIQEECIAIENGMVYEPLYGEVCMAKSFEKGWIRGSYMGDSCNSKAKMYSWDFGVILLVDKKHIRGMRYAILCKPIYSLLCLGMSNDEIDAAKDEITVSKINWMKGTILHAVELAAEP